MHNSKENISKYIYTFTWLWICFQTPVAWIGVVFTLQADTVCALWDVGGQGASGSTISMAT